MTIDSHEREAFRVKQNLVFDFRLVDPVHIESQHPEQFFAQDAAVSLLSQLKRIDREANATLKTLADKNRLLGDYLKSLNQKIDLVLRYNLFKQEQDVNTAEVSLSETGISFVNGQALAEGHYIAVRLVFLPDYIPLFAFAKVLRSHKQQEAYQIAAEFYKLSDKDRQELARQVFKTQVNRRKQQTQSNG